MGTEQAIKNVTPTTVQQQHEIKSITSQPVDMAATVMNGNENEDDVIVLNAPEPSRTKNLSDTKLPPEAKEHVCLECSDSLATDNHK